MKLWDKVWAVFVLVIGSVFVATIAYEFFYIRRSYLKAEESRMDKVVAYYEKELESYLYKKTDFVKGNYLQNGKPIVRRLEEQKTFVYVEGQRGSWNKIGDEVENLKKLEKGYSISRDGKIYGYVQEINGGSYIFRLNSDELVKNREWNYYDVIIDATTKLELEDSEIKFLEGAIEKSYYLPIEGGALSIKLKRGGSLYYSVMTKGRRVFIIGGGILAFLILLCAGVLERSVSKTLKRAAKKMEYVMLDDEFKGRINLGGIHEFKILENALNNIIEEFKNKKKKYSLLYDELPIFSAILDLDLNLIEVNEYFKKNLKGEEEGEKETFLKYIPKDKVNLFTSIYRKLENKENIRNENFYVLDNKSNTRTVLLNMKKGNLEDRKEVILFTAIDTSSMDISKLGKSGEEKYDSLTNVYTEKYGHRYLEKYIGMCKISNFNFISIVIWPNFDMLGDACDNRYRLEHLKILVKSTESCLRGTDLIYKFDRNSFGLLFSMVKKSEVAIILKRITKIYMEKQVELGEKDEVSLQHVVCEYNGSSTKVEYIKEVSKKVLEKKESLKKSGSTFS